MEDSAEADAVQQIEWNDFKKLKNTFNTEFLKLN